MRRAFKQGGFSVPVLFDGAEYEAAGSAAGIVQLYAWVDRAAQQGDDDARWLRDEVLAPMLSPSELDEARRLTRALRPSDRTED
jgi:hypothetical protein